MEDAEREGAVDTDLGEKRGSSAPWLRIMLLALWATVASLASVSRSGMRCALRAYCWHSSCSWSLSSCRSEDCCCMLCTTC